MQKSADEERTSGERSAQEGEGKVLNVSDEAQT